MRSLSIALTAACLAAMLIINSSALAQPTATPTAWPTPTGTYYSRSELLTRMAPRAVGQYTPAFQEINLGGQAINSYLEGVGWFAGISVVVGPALPFIAGILGFVIFMLWLRRRTARIAGNVAPIVKSALPKELADIIASSNKLRTEYRSDVAGLRRQSRSGRRSRRRGRL